MNNFAGNFPAYSTRTRRHLYSIATLQSSADNSSSFFTPIATSRQQLTRATGEKRRRGQESRDQASLDKEPAGELTPQHVHLLRLRVKQLELKVEQLQAERDQLEEEVKTLKVQLLVDLVDSIALQLIETRATIVKTTAKTSSKRKAQSAARKHKSEAKRIKATRRAHDLK
ncbi:hypothetical protein PHYSODRAFT_339683 [Phytophthora sojae]|uniref:Uncharacterized protein n=1 Tax=Phytophthora sojae (strain P6497) TaxID=1094619 RepID=G5A5F3_PHYSP|nr:hypothetical protein PHYSODRAFT_339683 [Phytophthora sojae]EGZ09337.1 hypothetical protein PHYSODRAFT_339683 [Phytophthora sojae]|eukprot:XP_009535970.1 hypothetical protein PHYSODRAFT_339683 [Phytophthora sojae]